MLRWTAFAAGRHSLRTVRCFSVSTQRWSQETIELTKTRNIGIIAHIDAGKTTTTERMLYYSGHTRRIGDVDDGSTVTDFLPAERARGITIQSAAISFSWPPTGPTDDGAPNDTSRASAIRHHINLIDTPGHADFTFEVLRSLRVLDGAICILDGVAGVEAQTEKVWAQANRYRIPRIIFVNKLDRDGATFYQTVKEIGTKLRTWPAVCAIPWWRARNKEFCGVGDAVGLRALLWKEGSDGRSIETFNLDQLDEVDPLMAKELKTAREALVERLSEHDDQMVELFLEHEEKHLAIPESAIISSLRRCTLQYPQRVAPVYAGASFRNIGVQPLLDAAVDLMPSPDERPDAEVQLATANGTLSELLKGELLQSFSGTATSRRSGANKKKSLAVASHLQSCALAFKVVNDAKKGVLVYVRVYSGSLTRGAQLFNTNLNVVERAPRLLRMYASDAVEISSIDAGQIGVIVGLKHARTGDTLISYMGMNSKTGPPAPLDSLQLRPIAVPPPVFFTSVEPDSLSEEKQIADTLQILLREDPSLNVSTDSESGQTHLAGMGELHLEIARDRLINDFKAKARIGDIHINYRETLESTGKPFTYDLDREIGGKHAHAKSTAAVVPHDTDGYSSQLSEGFTEIALPDNNHLTISHPTLSVDGESLDDERSSLPQQLSFSVLIEALRAGVAAALARGPSYGYPIHSAHVILSLDPKEDIFADTSATALSVAAREAVHGSLQAAKKDAVFALMEPVMNVTISISENDLGGVVHDLTSARGAQIISLEEEDFTTGAATGSADEEAPMLDSKLIYAPPDPYMSGQMDASSASPIQLRNITARVPLREMVGYLKHLRSLSGGRGTFVMQVDRFEKLSGPRLKKILNEVR